MKKLLQKIRELKQSEAKNPVDKRMDEFRKPWSKKEVFNELCFCILTANYSSEGSIRVQEAIGDGFLTLTKKHLARRLKALGYRFPNVRAKYIVEARKHNIIKKREWLVENVKGIGYKEASHFLRNIGCDDYAIIDFHIIDLLVKEKLIEKPKTMNKKRYLEIEEVLKDIAKKSNLSLGELDLYLWYIETGKVLK